MFQEVEAYIYTSEGENGKSKQKLVKMEKTVGFQPNRNGELLCFPAEYDFILLKNLFCLRLCRKASAPFVLLSVQNKLGECYGLHDLAVLVNAHVARGDLVNENDLVAVVAKLKLDVPQVKTDGL